MFGLDMTLWNRVQYPSRKTVIHSVRDTTIVSLVVGIGSFATVWCASSIVSILVGVF